MKNFLFFYFIGMPKVVFFGLARGKFFANKKCAKRRDFGMKTPEFLENLRGIGAG